MYRLHADGVKSLHMTDERDAVLRRLAKTAETQARAVEQRDQLIRQGAALGIPKTTLADAAKLSRRAVYDILDKQEQT